MKVIGKWTGALLLLAAATAVLSEPNEQANTLFVQPSSDSRTGPTGGAGRVSGRNCDCHHAIKSAHHEGLEFNQNPFYRYIIESEYHIYPSPERCKSIEDCWISTSVVLDSAALDKATSPIESYVKSEIGLTMADIAKDEQFLVKVIRFKDTTDWHKLSAPDAIQ